MTHNKCPLLRSYEEDVISHYMIDIIRTIILSIRISSQVTVDIRECNEERVQQMEYAKGKIVDSK